MKLNQPVYLIVNIMSKLNTSRMIELNVSIKVKQSTTRVMKQKKNFNVITLNV